MTDLKDQGSDAEYAGRTIQVPASGRVEDAPRPNAAEPAVAAEPIDSVARVDAELAAKGPEYKTYDGDNTVNVVGAEQEQDANPYISAETVEGAEHTDNAAAEPSMDETTEYTGDDSKTYEGVDYAATEPEDPPLMSRTVPNDLDPTDPAVIPDEEDPFHDDDDEEDDGDDGGDAAEHDPVDDSDLEAADAAKPKGKGKKAPIV